MKNLFIINEEEKNRILNLHETATKRHYLSEQPYSDAYQVDDSDIDPKLVAKYEQPQVGPQNLQDTAGTIIKQGGGNDPYVYAKLGNDYYYAKASDGDNPNWVLAKKEKAINSIKSIIFNEKVPKIKTKTPPKKEDGNKKPPIPKKEDGNKKPPIPKKESGRQSNINKVYCSVKNGLITIGNYKNIKWVDYVKEWNILPTEIGIAEKSCPKKVENKNKGGARILKKLQDQGFKVDVETGFDPTKGYFVSACKEKGCAEFTNNMLNASLGDAWQAYSKVNAEINVSPSLVQQMTNLFNKMNKSGTIPKLDTKSSFDSEAKTIIQQLIPNQSNFQKLPIGTVVGLYLPKSSNYDLAFFQSAIGKSRDENGKLHDVISKPYFCKNPSKCSSTTWSENDLSKNVKFYPGNTLSSGKSFAPNTHLGFIGYKDKNGIPYVVHNVHQQVFAYPVTKLGGDGLSILWTGKSV
jgi:hypothetical protein